MPITHITRQAWVDTVADERENRTTTIDNAMQRHVFDAVDAAFVAEGAAAAAASQAMRDAAERMGRDINAHLAALLFGPIGGLVGAVTQDVVRVRPPARYAPPPSPPPAPPRAPVATLGGRRSIAFTDEE